MIYIILIGVALIVGLFILTGCGENNSSKTNNTSTKTNTTSKNETKTNTQTDIEKLDYALAAEKQMAKPAEGETIAIIHVRDFGDITVKFFNDKAPKAVENFVTHSKEGYYNGVKFHRVINEFMIQSGDPEGTGRGGESIWGKGFAEEFDYELVPYRGSLCMASAGVGTSSLGSQFFITQANYDEAMEQAMKKGGYPEKLLEQYKKYGGYLSLYLSYTVFGQVIDGMDVVDSIASVEKEAKGSSEKSSPIEDVIIDSIEVTTYKAQ